MPAETEKAFDAREKVVTELHSMTSFTASRTC